MSQSTILVINAGSSSLKLDLYGSVDDTLNLLFDVSADNIGDKQGTLTLKNAAGETVRTESLACCSPRNALEQASAWLSQGAPTPSAIGHRIVHGGPNLTQHQRITPSLLDELQAAIHFAPLHIPPALTLIHQAQQTYPRLPQFACFDTAFHTTLPEAASHFPLPHELYDQGIRRYGFHGLSYESIVHQLASSVPAKVVIAHLGAGASLCALDHGRSVDTSMGLTPTGGIPMATRTGDIDPGVLIFLQRTTNATADSLEHLFNRDSGLTALSNGIADMRELLASSAPESTLAVEVFCRSVAKFIASYASVLNGLDLLVFTGGIGEHSAPIRANICSRLTFMGVKLDPAANNSAAQTLSSSDSKVVIQTLPAQENLQIARHCQQLLHAQSM